MLLREKGLDEQAQLTMRGELTRLELAHSQIGDDGAELIAHFLKEDEVVVYVYLTGCNIGPRGVMALADALKYNNTVEILDLEYNSIGDKGGEALIDALNHNVCIEVIYLYNSNNISPESEAAIESLTQMRNQVLIPSAVRRASLCLISARSSILNAGHLAMFPKEIVKVIAMLVWATRKDHIWINALSDESERMGKTGEEQIH